MKKNKLGNLEDNLVFEKIRTITDDLTEHMVADEAKEFYNDLNIALKDSGFEKDSEIYNKYKLLLSRLGLTALPTLPIDKVYEVLKEYAAEGLADPDIDLFNGIRRKLIEYPMPFRDDIKKDMRKALRESTSGLGLKAIKVGTEEKASKPTVGNWIRDYDRYLGMGKHNKVERSKYLFQSDNVKNLTAEIRRKLDYLIKLYEKLKWSTYELGAIDNPSLEIFMPAVGPVERSQPRELGKLRERKRPSIPTGIIPREALKAAESAEKEEIMPEQLVEEKRPEPKRYATEKPKEALEPVSEAKPKSQLEEKAEQLRKGAPEREAGKSLPKPEKAEPKKSLAFDIKMKKAKAPKAISEESLKKLLSPQSLSQIDINDFRNFGKDEESSSSFLLSKIKKLASYSPLDKETVKNSLRKSALYKLYLSQGKESLDLKKSAGEVAEIRKRDGRAFMTEGEFEAVKKLFKSI